MDSETIFRVVQLMKAVGVEEDFCLSAVLRRPGPLIQTRSARRCGLVRLAVGLACTLRWPECLLDLAER